MKRYVKSERTILHPRKSEAAEADRILSIIRETESDEDILYFVVAYIPSNMLIEALEDMADKLGIAVDVDADLNAGIR